MDFEKVAVEMKELTPAEVQDDKAKCKLEATKEDKKDEKEEKDVYCKITNPTEEIYTSLDLPASSPKHSEDLFQKLCLYKRICGLLTILCVLLLAVLLALTLKLYQVPSIQECPDITAFEGPEGLNCSHQLCEILYPQARTKQNHDYQCSECGKGWLRFENSCYFMSKHRLSWQESRATCQKNGGDLAVINTENVQKFLTERGLMLYWIGLRYTEKQQWMWINNTVLAHSYWTENHPKPHSKGFCAVLRGQRSHMYNWFQNPCEAVSHYICQRD